MLGLQHGKPSLFSFGSAKGASKHVLGYIKNYKKELFSKAPQAGFRRVPLPTQPSEGWEVWGSPVSAAGVLSCSTDMYAGAHRD